MKMISEDPFTVEVEGEWPKPPASFIYSPLNPQGLVLDHHTSFLVLTYHTSGPNGAGYEQEAAGFVESMQQNSPHTPFIVLDAGGRESWRQANMIKAGAIAWAVATFGVPIVWIDCDARVRKPLTFFEGLRDRCDVALSIRKVNDEGAVRWNVGTSWWGTTTTAGGLLLQWELECELANKGEGKFRDAECDSNLFGLMTCALIEQNRWFMPRILNLPPELCFITDMDRERHPTLEPVIEQMQASRRKRGPHEPGRICWTMPSRGVVE